MPDRTEVIERLRELASREWDPDCAASDAPTRLLTQAADLLEAEESRTEYRVTSDARRTYPYADLKWCERTQGTWERCGYSNVRIQHHTVTETPWVDVEDGEADRG